MLRNLLLVGIVFCAVSTTVTTNAWAQKRGNFGGSSSGDGFRRSGGSSSFSNMKSSTGKSFGSSTKNFSSRRPAQNFSSNKGFNGNQSVFKPQTPTKNTLPSTMTRKPSTGFPLNNKPPVSNSGGKFTPGKILGNKNPNGTTRPGKITNPIPNKLPDLLGDRKPSGKLPGNIGNGKLPGKLGDGKFPGSIGNRPIGDIGEKLPGKISDGKLPGRIPGKLGEGRLPGKLGEGKLPGNFGNGKLPIGDVLDKVPGRLPDRLPMDKIPGKLKDKVGGGLLDHIDRNPHDIADKFGIGKHLGDGHHSAKVIGALHKYPYFGNFHWHHHGHHHFHHWNWWVLHRPSYCYWWFDYCAPLRVCDPGIYTVCNWHYYTPTVVVSGNPVVAQYRWYFGMKGMILPGQGIGVESVESGSPAEQAGLQPGMVLTQANGIDLTSEDAMNQAINGSQGTLRVTVLVDMEADPQSVDIQLARIRTASF